LEDNAKIDLREIGWGGMDWIDQAQDRNQWQALADMVKCLVSTICWEIPKYLRDW
jgi:hypothetical protein